MILIPQAKNNIYGVVGLGKSGRATIASLLASGAEVFAWDDKETTRAAVQQEFAAVKIGAVAEWDFSRMASLVMSPGILLNHPAVIDAQTAGVEVIGDIELLYRAQPEATYVGITGTNGKSTTTTLIAHVLKACGKRVEVGGNLGTAALALAPLSRDGIYVLELSSYQLDLVRSTRFNVAVLLNISPDHLDHHGSMAAYIQAKEHLFDRQTADDTAVVGIDDADSAAICDRLAAGRHTIPISVTQEVARGVWTRDGMLHNTLQEPSQTGDLRQVKALQGEHNWQNAAAAYAVCTALGCAHDAVMKAMQTYPGLSHRMEWLGEVNSVAFVNDSKATNADAAEKALKTYDDIYWIAGGVAKEGGIAPLAGYFPKIRHAYLIGESAADFAKTLEGKVPYTISETLEKAFYAAAHAATEAAQKTGRVAPVVLAPACASFDQFANFEVRGEAFRALYHAWKSQGDAHGSAA